MHLLLAHPDRGRDGGVGLATQIHDLHAPPGVDLRSFALFMGVAMSITAFPVLARILVERDLLTTRVGAVTITCAAVDDITAWCLLAFLVAFVGTGSLGGAAGTLGLTLVYLAVMFLVMRPLLRRMSAMVERSGRLSQNMVAVVFLLVLTSALCTELIGIHAIFGAFMLGAVLPKDALFTRELDQPLDVAGGDRRAVRELRDPGIARRGDQLLAERRGRNGPGQRMLAAARSDQQDSHPRPPCSIDGGF